MKRRWGGRPHRDFLRRQLLVVGSLVVCLLLAGLVVHAVARQFLLVVLLKLGRRSGGRIESWGSIERGRIEHVVGEFERSRRAHACAVLRVGIVDVGKRDKSDDSGT